MGLRLQTRLILLSTVLIVASMLLGLGFQLVKAHERVQEEMEAALELAWELVDSMLPPETAQLDGQERADMLARLQNIEAVRHLDIRLIGNGGSQLTVMKDEPHGEAPQWFVRLVNVESLTRQRMLSNGGDVLLIRSDAAAEIDETWDEAIDFLVVLLLALVGFNLVLHLAINRWLAPLQQIVTTIDQAGRGEFTGDIPVPGLPELRGVIFKLNELTASLRYNQQENLRLTRLSLQIQELERHKLANDLHDEMGQSLSAIKSIAWSLEKKTAEDLVVQGAGQIGRIAAHMSGHLRSLLGQLRPALLDELGLVTAVATMVDEWNAAHERCRCEFVPAAEFDAIPIDQQIHVYRILQAALTNVATHAGAGSVWVTMEARQGNLRLTVRDDGKGFNQSWHRPGRGLTGMKERCQALGGYMSLKTGEGKGAELDFVFPRTDPQAEQTP